MVNSRRNIFRYRRLRDSRYLVRMAFVGIFLLLMTLIMPRSLRLKFQYEVGKAWQGADLEAPFSFSIYKSPDSIAAEKIRVAREVLPIFVKDTSVFPEVSRKIRKEWENVYLQLEKIRQIKSQGEKAREELSTVAAAFSRQYKIAPEKLENSFSLPGQSKMAELSIGVAQKILEKGYINTELPDSLGDIVSLRLAPAYEEYKSLQALLVTPDQLESFVETLPIPGNPAERELVKRISLATIQPDMKYDEVLTRQVREIQVALVSPVYGSIREGEKIISKDEIVDKSADAILRSLIYEQSQHIGEQNAGTIIVSQFLIILVITIMLLSYLSVNKPRIYFNNAKLGLILFTMLLTVASMVVATKLNDLAERLSDIIGPNLNLSYIYIAPACIVPIFITNFFGLRTGFLCNLLISFYGGVLIQQGLEFVFIQMIAGTVAVYSLRKLRKREIFFYTLAYIFLAYTLSYILFNLYSKGDFADINYRTILLFMINVAITIIAYNLIFLFEQIFGLTSDLTYLELLDTNHPLLKELARKAPGTFHHSLQVANIAEATINEIGGNALLTHVGALYHDVGKMVNHRFFIENMSEGQNPHDQLSCEESTGIIIGHVKRGIELAHKYSLPREIIEFIETHHGTTRVEYFYRIFLKENNCDAPEAEDRFRYPGPKPFSKETAVLMISDSIEAASRAMKNPTPEKLKELVDNVVDYKIKDNQLENSNLTFNDIAVIRKVIHKQLLSIYHSRIQYPGPGVSAERSV
ncbi:MAG: HDIG domain-containing protein [Bacteroidia bacterium]|nr:HDIG domain-containing protein [Bacteroidia bacterium]